jgi:hypothetical protein
MLTTFRGRRHPSELNIAELDENAGKAQKLNNVNNEEVFHPRPNQSEKPCPKSKQPIQKKLLKLA